MMNKFKISSLILFLIIGFTSAAQAGSTVVFHWEVENGAEPSQLEESNGGTAIRVRNNQGTANGSWPDANRTKTQNFTVACTGRYYLQARFCAPSASRNSWYIHIRNGGSFVSDEEGNNDTSGDGSAWGMPIGSCNRTDTVGDDNGTETRYWILSQGVTYTLAVRGREHLARLFWLEVVRDDGYAGTNCGTPTPLPTPTPMGSGTGLSGFYYNDPNLTNDGDSPQCRLDPTVNFNWAGSPNDGTNVTNLGADNFSVMWVGEIEAPITGSYRFYFTSDDGVRLYINGSLQIDQFTAQTATEYSTGTYTLTAGDRVDITIDYFEAGGDAVAELRWTGPGISKSIIPSDRLYPEACAVPTRIPTPIGTPTPTPLPYTSGLDDGGRLYGLEYIPFPAQTVSGNVFMDLGNPVANSAANNNLPRNTARWRITFRGVTATVGNTLEVETRIGDAAEAVDCESGIYGTEEFPAGSGEYRFVMPERPQNISRTYAWLNSQEVPHTERYDVVGDPRLVPYKDVLGIPSGQSFANGYNWFFMDIDDNARNPWPAYRPYLQSAEWTRYNNGPVADVPKGFALWRNGLQESASIYTSMSGYNSYYVGLGGEIGGDSANDLNGGVPMSNAPYGGGGSSDRNELTGPMQFVRTYSTSSATGWRSLPFMGELWPDWAYTASWSNTSGPGSSWGNLPTNTSGSSSMNFRRDNWANCGSAAVGALPVGVQPFSFINPIMRTNTNGSGSFLNGSSNGSASFNHYFHDNTATLMDDGMEMGPNYQFALPATYAATRPFGLQAGNSQPEWTRAPYSTQRNMLDIFSSNAGASAANIGYYRRVPASSATNDRTSAAVRVVNPVTRKAGWVVVNGFDRAGTSGDQFLSKFAVLSCFRTFHDAGAPTVFAPQGYTNNSNIKNVGGNNEILRIEPIPLVRITKPSLSDETKSKSTIPVVWEQHYRRWDQQRYTDYYPTLVQDPDDSSLPGDPNAVQEWHSLPAADLSYNIKYSDDGGGNWYMVQDDSLAQPGVYDDAYKITHTARTLSWDWSVGGMASGNKIFRVECFRQNFAQHYAYHELVIYTSP